MQYAARRSYAYSDVPSFAADLRLIFENATTYNPPRNAVHAAAMEIIMSRDFDADLESRSPYVSRNDRHAAPPRAFLDAKKLRAHS